MEKIQRIKLAMEFIKWLSTTIGVANDVFDIKNFVVCFQFLNFRIVICSGEHSYITNGSGYSNSLIVRYFKN